MTDTASSVVLLDDDEMPPFKIKMGMDKGGDPRVWIGICANTPLQEWIAQTQVSPHILYIVWHEGSQFSRHMAERIDHVIHVVIPKAGTFTVEAILVWPDVVGEKNFRQIRSMLFRRNGYAFTSGTHEIVDPDDYDGNKPMYMHGSVGRVHNDEVTGNTAWTSENRDKRFTVRMSDHSAFYEVEIDADLFADEPMAITKWWVGMFFPNSQFDECRMRGKIIASVPLTMFWLPVHYVIKMVSVLVAMMLGLVYGNGFQHVWKPGSHGGFGVMFSGIDANRTAWWYKKDSSFDYSWRNGWTIFTISLLQFFAAMTLIAWAARSSNSELESNSFADAAMIPLVITGGIGALCLFIYVFATVYDAIVPKRQQAKARAARTERLTEIQQLERAMESTMSCDVSIDERRAQQSNRLHVWFHGKKDDRCRPFQQR